MEGPTPSKQVKLTDSSANKEHDPPACLASASSSQPSSSSKTDSLEQESTLEVLEQIDICQGELENLNEEASEEIIQIEEKFNRLRQPHIDKRNEFIKQIPNFWICTFVNHPQIAPRLSEEDEECLHYLRQLVVRNYDDLKTGYSITFHFAKNPFFENETISKEFSLTEDGEPTSKSSEIHWKPGMDITKKLRSKGKMDVPCASFFGWFSDHLDAGNDEIADVLRDDLWSNPLQYYLIPDVDDSLDKSALMDSLMYSDDESNNVEVTPVIDPESRPITAKKDANDDSETAENHPALIKSNDKIQGTEDKLVENNVSTDDSKETVRDDGS
ncbi:protein SET-like [Patiria miniata]|uniref:Protein SET n=1 Tax=Patiria miniata TaxID=46514 RepID=A0A913ZSH3_PATMI|nr:protein SET-like [Patiria miniata]XP_038054041.1 protein SET-like [Patiria miniata]XP_038054042.1 protein SET-like [Patiria miniata]XP_038054043.1 protein SET-like [Patiria miniata]